MVNKNSFVSLLYVVLFFSIDGFSQQKEIDSLQSVIARSSDTTKFDAIISLVRVYGRIGNNKEALKYSKQGDTIAYKVGDSSRIAISSRIIGQLLNRLSMYQEAEKIIIKTLSIVKRNGLQKDYKSMLHNLAIAYTFQAKYDKALITNFKALALYEKDKEYPKVTLALNNIGIVYYKLKNYQKALEFYQQALRLKKKINDTNDLDRLLSNTGLCYDKLKYYAKAFESFKDAFKQCGENCNNIAVEGMHGLGVYYYETNNLGKARNYFNQSYSIAKKNYDRRFEAENLFSLALISIQENDSKSSIKLLTECAKIAKTGSYNEILIDTYNEFRKFYKRINDFKNAFNYQDKYIQLRDSVYGEELTQNLMVAQAEYEQRENKAQIDSQRQMLYLKEEIITRQNWINTLAGITVALMIALVFLLYRSNLQKKRVNQLLELKVKERTKELERSYVALQQTHQEQIQLISKTSNDMKSPLSTMKGLCSLALKELPGTNAQEYLGQINTTIKHMSDLIGRLSPM